MPKRDYRYKQEKRLTGKLINYKDTRKTRELRAWLNEYNSFVQSFEIDLPIDLEPVARIATTFRRVFNSDFHPGGRLVGYWIFNIKREQRYLLKLNGEQVAELDFKSMYPILLKHAPIEHLLFDKETANHCTYLEATLLQKILNHYLLWKVPVLPMHDGIITIKSERNRLKKVMEFEAERFLVSVPGVEIEY